MAKLLWVDTETSGLHAQKNGILSIAGLYEEESTETSDVFDYRCRPHPNDKLNSRALEVNGFKRKEVYNFPCSYHILSTIEGFLLTHLAGDKFTICGYNTSFDFRFIEAWFEKHGNENFNTYFHREYIDVLPMVRRYFKSRAIPIENHKLPTVAEYFGISGAFHTALDDILATYQIYHHVKED